MTSIYHRGELAVQNQAGVQAEAAWLGKNINAIIQPSAQDFLRSQESAIAGTIDTNGKVWASLLTGEPGFIQTITEHTVRINAAPIPGDPFKENLLQHEIGILVIDLATRRRLRINGRAELQLDGSIYVHTKQVYYNCPKYIQTRHLDISATKAPARQEIQHSDSLNSKQQQWITQTDTFFIASFHPTSGVDASHRGGYPGFVRVLNASKLVFPDYAGNNMFNTLGNIFVNPRAGLLFIDFEHGNTLQLTGKARIIWDAECLKEFAGAERLVEFEIKQVLEITHASSLHWQFGKYSPFNPASGD